jgi:hypothetical protein
MSIAKRLERLEDVAGDIRCPHCGRAVPMPARVEPPPAMSLEERRRVGMELLEKLRRRRETSELIYGDGQGI